ncbi:MAG: hypothetical protein IH598_02990 [Bacteroidales bacterium]|nr:hypothetical protein [Bacteroidales bacterium]
MRFWRFFSFAMLILTGVAIAGCSKDEDEPVVDMGPALTLKTGEGYTSADFEVIEGTTVKFGVTASKSTTHEHNLVRFNILYNTLTLVDTVFDAPDFNADFEIQFVGVGVGKVTFKITAHGGLTDEKELNATVTEPPYLGEAVKKVTNIELGSFNDPIGSFYNTVDDLVYIVPEAKLNQAKVDFLFFKGVTFINSIAAPDDEDANTIPSFELGDWTTKNQTRFNASTMTAAEFDAIGDLHIFPDYNTTDATSKVSELEVGQVFMFRTVGEKLGYIKVVDTYEKGDKIKIDVIVME